MKETLLIHVDANDAPLGVVEKMAAHREGILHRAFSIFIFDSEGHWLLQQRALTKYHSPGLWTNACCGHPEQGEKTEEAAIKRLRFEMGITCNLRNVFSFTYRAQLENGLVEHEYDHVYIGFSDEDPEINPEEVKRWRFVTYDQLQALMQADDRKFSEWFKLIYERVNEYWSTNPG